MRTLAGVSSARTALMADSSYAWGTLCNANSRSLHADQTRLDQIEPDQTWCAAEHISGVPNGMLTADLW